MYVFCKYPIPIVIYHFSTIGPGAAAEPQALCWGTAAAVAGVGSPRDGPSPTPPWRLAMGYGIWEAWSSKCLIVIFTYIHIHIHIHIHIIIIILIMMMMMIIIIITIIIIYIYMLLWVLWWEKVVCDFHNWMANRQPVGVVSLLPGLGSSNSSQRADASSTALWGCLWSGQGDVSESSELVGKLYNVVPSR